MLTPTKSSAAFSTQASGLAWWKLFALCAVGIVITWTTLPKHSSINSLAIWHSDQLIDAAAFRNGAQFLHTPYLYNPAAYVAAQRGELGAKTSYRVYLRPPWYAVATQWLARMPYLAAMVTWKLLMIAAIVAFVIVWPQRGYAAIAMCWSYPLAAAIEQGQDVPVVVAALALSGILASGRRDVLSGCTLALCTIKPNLMVFVPAALFAAGRRRLIIGVVAAFEVLLAISFWAQGRDWPRDFFHLLASPQYYNSFTESASLVQVFRHAPETLKAVESVVFTLLLVPCVVLISRRRGIETGLYAAGAAAVITSSHAYLQDVLLVAPFALTALRDQLPLQRWTALFILSPLSTYLLARWIPGIGALAIALPVLTLLISTQLSSRPVPPEKGTVCSESNPLAERI